MLEQQMRSAVVSVGLQASGPSVLRLLLPKLRHAGSTTRQGRQAAPRAAAAVHTASSSEEQQQHVPHVSVLLQEVLHNLNHMPIKVYVDCTLGAGGHLAAMMQQHPELQTCVGIDVDPTAHRTAAATLAPLLSQPGAPTLHQLTGNYSDVVPLLTSCPGGSLVGQVDAMLMDLGVSSMQLDVAERGFSFAADGPIDMRMGPTATQSAEELVNTASEAELGVILRDYGEEKSWKAVARRIVAAREVSPITTTQQLVQVIGQTQIRGSSSGGSSSRRSSSSGKGGGRGIHPATRTFQALRIAVNDELGKLQQALPAAVSCLSPGGRLAVISFHSLEDRLVKHAFLRAAGRPTPDMEAQLHGPDGWLVLDQLASAATGSLVTRKALAPTEAEVAANPRSRSAKLRVFQRAGGPLQGGEGSSSSTRSSSSRSSSSSSSSSSRGRHSSKDNSDGSSSGSRRQQRAGSKRNRAAEDGEEAAD